MRLLIAPAHYKLSITSGSEYTRAYNYISEIAKDESYEGDIIVGNSNIKQIGNFKIHSLYQKEKSFLSISDKFTFVFKVFFKSLLLTKKNSYDCIWHLGPFSIGETFNPIALLLRQYKFFIGPVYSPLNYVTNVDSGHYRFNSDGSFSEISYFERASLSITHIIGKFTKVLSSATLKRADIIFAIDNGAKNLISKLTQSTVYVTPLSIECDKFLHAPRKYPKDIHKIKLLSVSYLADRKKMLDVVKGIEYLVNTLNIKNISLDIIGDGPQKNIIKEYIQKNNLSSYIKLLGYVPNNKISKYYHHADIFISCSVSDSMPGMYFEAMAASLPMILSQNSSSIYLQKAGFGGVVVKDNLQKTIATAIIKLVQNVSVYKSYSQKNHNLSVSKFYLPSQITKFKKIISNL